MRIPAGEFLYGEKKQKRCLPEYYIDVYPLTNAEYKKFVEEKGYETEKCWTEEGWKSLQQRGYKKPKYWDDEKLNKPDHPVVGISWYEAKAYAEWRSKMTGKKYRLPTEEEWEKAARGVDGREYPWGSDFNPSRCNTSESGIKSTTPVNGYENGKSPYGYYNMAGNVWEWTDSLWKESDPNYVVRGGSWGDHRDDVRCAYRDWIHPVIRSSNLGVRFSRTS